MRRSGTQRETCECVYPKGINNFGKRQMYAKFNYFCMSSVLTQMCFLNVTTITEMSWITKHKGAFLTLHRWVKNEGYLLLLHPSCRDKGVRVSQACLVSSYNDRYPPNLPILFSCCPYWRFPISAAVYVGNSGLQAWQVVSVWKNAWALLIPPYIPARPLLIPLQCVVVQLISGPC